MNKSLTAIALIMALAFPMRGLAAADSGKQNGHNHAMQGDMKHDMKNMMDHDMPSMMKDMEKMHLKMADIVNDMEASPEKSQLMKLHQAMTKSMNEMKMMHGKMNHEMPKPEAKKSEHKHKH